MRESLEAIQKAVLEMDEDQIIPLIDRALEEGISAETIYNEGLSGGMLEVTRYFEEEKYYVSEVIVCADTLNKGVQYLQAQSLQEIRRDGPKIVLGVVEGDLHEIGKNIVKIMFQAANFEVYDLGLNVRAEDFIKKAEEVQADIIGLSTMMTTTMGNMAEVVRLNQKKTPLIIIGGGPISQSFADEIGADGYSRNAVEAVELVRRLTHKL